MTMKTNLSIVLLLCQLGAALKTGAQEKPAFDKLVFYKSMATDKKAEVDAELNLLQRAGIPGLEAYVGALTMKKAEFAGIPSKKLNLFKSGHRKLESAIKNEHENAEYRFLRLMIQENAPAVLGYKNDIKADSEYIRKSYKNLPEDIQQVIIDYSKKSKTLRAGDF
jgi:hypothetical protein